MEVYSIDVTSHLVEAYIIETFKTRARDCSDAMVRDEEIFLPAHKYVFALCEVFEVKVWTFGLLRKGPPGWKSAPMLHVNLLIRTPFIVSRLEGVFGANYFAFEVSGESRMVVGET